MDNAPPLGSTLAKERRSRAVSQARLARRTGIPQPAISRIEAGREVPSLERFGRLLAGLGLRLDLDLVPLGAHRADQHHRAAILRMTPGERLEQAAAWGRFAGELRGAARR